MDADRLDSLARVLIAIHARRGAFGALVDGSFGPLNLAGAAAKRRG